MKSISTRAALLIGLTALLIGLTALLSVAAFAQTTAPQSGTEKEGPRGRHGRMGKHGGGQGLERRALHRLNLSDAQRGQLRDIESRYSQNFKAQREEMRQLLELRREGATLTPEQQARAQQLRTELRDNGERMRNEILGLLTPEQREQLKQLREEHKSRRDERREGFGQPTDNQ